MEKWRVGGCLSTTTCCVFLVCCNPLIPHSLFQVAGELFQCSLFTVLTLQAIAALRKNFGKKEESQFLRAILDLRSGRTSRSLSPSTSRIRQVNTPCDRYSSTASYGDSTDQVGTDVASVRRYGGFGRMAREGGNGVSVTEVWRPDQRGPIVA